MSIPTRDELIERARAFLRNCPPDLRTKDEICADLLESEIRRALVAELEALRDRSWDEVFSWRDAVNARLAALRSEQAASSIGSEGSGAPAPEVRGSPCPPPALSKSSALSKVAAGSRAPDRVENAQDELPGPGSSLSDAEADARFKASAADEATMLAMRPEISTTLAAALRAEAERLRAASAPKPEDVFEAFMHGLYEAGAQNRARDWFGPLVEALEKARHALGSTDTAVHDCAIDEIDAALAALRRKAEEASRG